MLYNKCRRAKINSNRSPNRKISRRALYVLKRKRVLMVLYVCDGFRVVGRYPLSITQYLSSCRIKSRKDGPITQIYFVRSYISYADSSFYLENHRVYIYNSYYSFACFDMRVEHTRNTPRSSPTFLSKFWSHLQKALCMD